MILPPRANSVSEDASQHIEFFRIFEIRRAFIFGSRMSRFPNLSTNDAELRICCCLHYRPLGESVASTH